MPGVTNAAAWGRSRLRVVFVSAALAGVCVGLSSCSPSDYVDDTSNGSPLVSSEGRYNDVGIGATESDLETRGFESGVRPFQVPPKAATGARFPFRVDGDSIRFPGGRSLDGIDMVMTDRWATFMLRDDRTVAYVISGVPVEAGRGSLGAASDTLSESIEGASCRPRPTTNGTQNSDSKLNPVCVENRDTETLFYTGSPVKTITVLDAASD